jgi:hypothetical protein
MITYLAHWTQIGEGGGPQPLSINSTRNICRALIERYKQFIISVEGKDVVFINWLVIGCGFCEESFCVIKYSLIVFNIIKTLILCIKGTLVSGEFL